MFETMSKQPVRYGADQNSQRTGTPLSPTSVRCYLSMFKTDHRVETGGTKMVRTSYRCRNLLHCFAFCNPLETQCVTTRATNAPKSVWVPLYR